MIDGFFIHPGKMTPGLPLLLFAYAERWMMICWLHVKN